MKLWKAFACILATLLMISGLSVSTAAASSNPFVQGPTEWELKNELTKAMDARDYDAAKAQLNSLSLNFPDSFSAYREYSLYLEALASMDASDFQSAAQIFNGLSQDEEGFYDSQLLYAYCSGRAMQDAGNYTEAISWYTQAVSYDDAAQRIQECIKLQKQVSEAAAQNLYQRGLATNDIELLQEAEACFNAISNAEMAKKCQTEIDRINKQTSYTNAMKQYSEALASSDVLALRSAAASFSALGDYEDSAEMAKKINELVTTLQRVLTLSSSTATVTTIDLTWKDSLTGSTEYVVAWAPAGNQTTQSMTVSEAKCSLTGLFPNTSYHVSISIQGALQPLLEVDVATKRADNYAGKGFTVRYSYVFAMRRSYLNSMSMGELLQSKPQAVEYPEENVIGMEDIDASMQNKAYGYLVSFKQAAALQGPVTIQWLLRTKASGVYASEVLQAPSMPDNGYVICSLDELLDPLYIDQNAWPEEPCTLELYINSTLAARSTFTILVSE